MPDYEKGKIYKLYSPSKNLVYFGSTTQTLSQRLAKHVWCFNNNVHLTNADTILECEDYKIELVEDYPCNNRKQLERREGEFIQNYDCVNRYVAGRTHKEYCEIYDKVNRERLLEYKKQHYQKNKEHAADLQRKYRAMLKEKKSALIANDGDLV